MQVTLKAEISKLTTQKDHLDEKYKDAQDEISRLQIQVTRLIGKPMDNVEKREELELQKQFRMTELEEALTKMETEQADMQEELFHAQEQILELKFEKETYDLQYARLQKRIQELDQYKEKTQSLSSVLKKAAEADLDEINDIVGITNKASSKKKDTNKFRQRSLQSVGELEMLVESLKRVIEKLKIENENLKKENAKHAGQGEKVNTEKQLRQKINNLEQAVHSYEMKDVNLDERERTIKKLIEANRQLRDDL